MSDSKKLVTLETMQEFNEKKTKNIFIAADGSTAIQGNLTVSGSTTIQDTETLAVKDNIIVANVDGNTLIENSGFVVKTNSSEAYGITYDPIGNGVKIGLGNLNENGKFSYVEGEDQFLATRADIIADGNLVQWDDEAKTLVDTGWTVESIQESVAKTIATFNITEENTTITLQNLTDMTKIDWGDGTVNSELSHTYAEVGEYVCKIYGVTSIGDDAFSGCSSLTSIEIPNSVTSIGGYAFAGCDNLTSVVIGEKVTSIGDSAFSYCTNLKSIEIPNRVTYIGSCSFQDCYNLISIVIGSGVTSIGDYAFANCDSLTSIFFKNITPVEFNESWFSNSTNLRYIYVFYGFAENYKEKWWEYGASEEILNKITETTIEIDSTTLKADLQCYVDNLPDNLVLDDIAKAKWQEWLGLGDINAALEAILGV